MTIQQGHDELTVVLDMTEKNAPVFLVYDGAGHLLGGVKDVTVHTIITAETYAEVTFYVKAVQVIGEFANVRMELGLEMDVNSKGDITLRKQDYRYATACPFQTETAPPVTIAPNPYKAMRTVMTKLPNGDVVAKPQAAREFKNGEWDWEDM
jgi:hypothetical protein